GFPASRHEHVAEHQELTGRIQLQHGIGTREQTGRIGPLLHRRRLRVDRNQIPVAHHPKSTRAFRNTSCRTASAAAPTPAASPSHAAYSAATMYSYIENNRP